VDARHKAGHDEVARKPHSIGCCESGSQDGSETVMVRSTGNAARLEP
jgi:hypothetical protein